MLLFIPQWADLQLPPSPPPWARSARPPSPRGRSHSVETPGGRGRLAPTPSHPLSPPPSHSPTKTHNQVKVA